MDRAFLILGAAFGATAVAMGAAGAHALKARLDAQALEWVDTAVRYQMWHALALVGAAALAARAPALPFAVAGWAWVAGIVLFSGALYALAFTGVRGFAHVAPFGGLALIAGWVALAWYGVASLR